MNSFLRLLAGFVAIIFSATFGGPAHRLLPPKVRMRSFGFIALSVAFFAAAVLRHVWIGGYAFDQLFVGHSLYFLFLLSILGRTRATELALYMAVSVGVDLLVGGLGLLGFDISSDTIRARALGWEFGATAIVVVRLWVSRSDTMGSA